MNLGNYIESLCKLIYLPMSHVYICCLFISVICSICYNFCFVWHSHFTIHNCIFLFTDCNFYENSMLLQFVENVHLSSHASNHDLHDTLYGDIPEPPNNIIKIICVHVKILWQYVKKIDLWNSVYAMWKTEWLGKMYTKLNEFTKKICCKYKITQTKL